MVSKRITRRAPAKKIAKAEVANLRKYELTYVLKPDIADESLESAIDKVSQIITVKGGTVSGVEKWGKRKLAYPIKHYLEGNYVFCRFELTPKASHEIENTLQISEDILRYLIIQTES